jgi:phosphopantothenoylcysteine decarboxylase/phosphopantothenate--cysteine ligase
MKKIIVGVTGGIAAYKAAELVRLLKKAGHAVQVVLTQGAQAFIQPLTFQALTGESVYSDLFAAEEGSGMDHIALAKWADLVLIAPASAHCIAQLAQGLAGDLLSTLCLATPASVVIAPAMNVVMWQHPATQANLGVIQARGVTVWGPDVGSQACGDNGAGRLMAPEQIARAVAQLFQNTARLSGQRWLLTAGPTRESLDPVRYFSNRSTGHMGYALAAAAAQAGAEVRLISGPTALEDPPEVSVTRVETAQAMHEAVLQAIADTPCDVFVGTAAVADYRPAEALSQKIKKTQDEYTVTLVPNPDILLAVSTSYPDIFTVGFCAQTEDLIENAKKKMNKKQLDMIVANQVGYDVGFGDVRSELFILDRQGESAHVPLADKASLAHDLLAEIAQRIVI